MDTPRRETSSLDMRHLLLAAFLLASAPGCVLMSAANHLSDPSFPEQDAEIASVASSSVEVRVRSLDGEVERTTRVTPRFAGEVTSASVAHAWRRTQGVNPFAIFRSIKHESCYEVTLVGTDGDDRRDVPILSVPPSTGAKVASYALMPLGLLVDMATFPLEWIGLLIFM